MLAATAVPAYLISTVTSYQMLLFYAFLVGFAGNSFSVGIAWVAAWWPREHQGLALGDLRRRERRRLGHQVHRAGPHRGRSRSRVHGWLLPRWLAVRPVPVRGAASVMATVTWFVSPRHDHKPRGRSDRRASCSSPLKQARVWRFSLYYVVVFGAYVALAAWLPKYYVDVYDQSLWHGALLTATLHLPRFPAAARSVAGCQRQGRRPAGHVLDLHHDPRGHRNPDDALRVHRPDPP